jgi:hypothetical protein
MFYPLRCYKHHKLLKLGECVEEQLLVNPHNVRFFYTRQQTKVLSPLKVEGVEYIMRGKVVEVTLIEIIKGKKTQFFHVLWKCKGDRIGSMIIFFKRKEALLSYILVLGRKMLKILKPNIKIVQKIMGLVYYNLVSI